jgi:hypothetical protein
MEKCMMSDEILPEAGAFYIMDRGYVDFRRLFIFTLSAACFVVRGTGGAEPRDSPGPAGEETAAQEHPGL